MNETVENRCLLLHAPHEPIKAEDIYVMYCGSETCESLHHHGPVIRNHFIIHFIRKGKGTLKINNKVFPLSANQCFVIFPGYQHYYEADKYDPWAYTWIAFNGVKAEWYLNQAALSIDNPVFDYFLDEIFDEIISEIFLPKKYSITNEIKLLGVIYILFSELIEIRKSNKDRNQVELKEYYYTKAIEFIKINYSRNLTVNDIANYIGISRSYLYYIFKEFSNLSIHQLLINYRIEAAVYLMSDRQLSISEISRSVGYEDPLQFSSIFKRIRGMSPSSFRSKLFPLSHNPVKNDQV